MILEQINQVLVQLVQTYNIKYTYVDEGDPWSGILSASVLTMISTENRLKVYSPGKLVFGRNMIILIKNKADWK